MILVAMIYEDNVLDFIVTDIVDCSMYDPVILYSKYMLKYNV